MFNNTMKNTVVLITLMFSIPAICESLTENAEWNRIMERDSVKGVFVLCKGSSQRCVTNNKERTNKTFLPASTFKIANALIGLETGVINSEYQIFRWDGKPRAMKQWEKDLTLRNAIQVSAVPVFQQIARDIGEQRMQSFLTKFSYGNANIGGGIDQFWLTGQLRISALNQVTFLETLYADNLPASKINQHIVKEILITEASPDYVVHSKTGYSGAGTPSNPGIGWWVGWIEKGTEVYFFAFNMDMISDDQLPLRKTMPTRLLIQEDILPSVATTSKQ